MGYLLDSNVFIQAKNLHYGFDFCPAFWDWLDVAHRAGDDLADWARAQPGTFFIPADAAALPSLQETTTWATGAGYEAAAVSTFLQGADYYLVAQAKALGHTLVTHEIIANTVKKVKIPNACLVLGITYMGTFQMLRHETARFVLP